MRRIDNEKHWVEIITAARTDASGVSAYCRDNAISKKNYYVWYQKLKDQHTEWIDLKRGRQTAAAADGKPKTEVTQRARRRRFTAEYKSEILIETDSAVNGNVGAILRREGLYSSTLQKWRQERAKRALAPKKRGPAANPMANENKRLKEENSRLQRKLAQAHDIIEVQKKIASILGNLEGNQDA